MTTGMALASNGHATEPKVAECLAAHDASIASRNELKLRDARAALLICASPSCPNDVQKECSVRVSEVTSEIPSIVFDVKDGAGADLSAVRVTMDGQPLALQLTGAAIAVDPGEHEFSFEAAGNPLVKKRFILLQGQKDRRETITLGPPEGPSLQRLHTSAGPSAPPDSKARGLGPQKIGAIAAGGVGVAGIAVAAIFGIKTISRHKQASDVCPDRCATQDGKDSWSDARTAGNISTIGFLVGAVGLGTGAALWFTAKPSREVSASAQLVVGPGALRFTGTF